MSDTSTINKLVVLPKTMISFLNIKIASAPIQNAEVRVKYWIMVDMAVHAIKFSVLSTPTINTKSIKRIAMQSCA